MSQSPHLIRLGPHELAHLMDLRDVQLVDVRDPEEFESCHIHGAISDPLDRFDPTRYSQEQRARMVLCCGTGKRSAQAADRLLKQGVPAVRHLEGGLNCWLAAHLSVDRKN
jgi:rhodanese-related sulfurtransferase